MEYSVYNKGIIHGLPSIPNTEDNLTALVTGATGLSGYHLVKVLASSSSRWSKIYCLSSRSPPESFWNDLGDAAARVEHVAVDFLEEPDKIAHALGGKAIDYVFYFSYKQPAPEGDALNLWANAEKLEKLNLTMFQNFISALKLADIKPRRFMLQTGSKHYAFYLGPAAIPAFESDPRVLIDGNFYYPQEDTLFEYCKTKGIEWSISRPTYIIGAVRDGSLNHLIGFGVYASIQAYLKKPIAFPGDYRAWDREQHQSTGELNAHFQEWLVLSGHTANEAFNIHNGDSFTWGRLWPYLAHWYGVEWNPPETDDSKYRTVTLDLPVTPRGYGPQATMRSTFSLLEWSQQPEVELAWKEISKEHGLVLDPFDRAYRARIFSFSDYAVIGDGPMTLSMRKARQYGFLGTVDSYRSMYDTFQELARLKMIVSPRNKFDL